MHVKMRHVLHAMSTGIGNSTEALRHIAHLADSSDSSEETRLLIRTRIGCKVVNANIGTLRDHQHMHRGLRCDVFERQGMLVLKNRAVGNFPTQDFGKIFWSS